MPDHLVPILDNCLALLQAGLSVDECLAVYPEHAQELAPLLRAAARLQAVALPEPRPEFLAESPARLVRRIQAGETARPASPIAPDQANGASAAPLVGRANGHRRPAPPLEVVPPLINGHRPAQPRPALRPRRLTHWLSLAAALLLAALLSLGTMNAAAASLPGDALYPLKRAGESVWLAVPRPPVQQAEAHLALAQARLDEVYRLEQRGDTGRAAQSVADYQAALTSAAHQAEAADPSLALGAAFGVDAERLRAAHNHGVSWRELTVALSLATRAGVAPEAVLTRLVEGEQAEMVLAGLSLPSVIIRALPALLEETSVSPPTTSPGRLPSATTAPATLTPGVGGLAVSPPTPTGPAATPSATPGAEPSATPASAIGSPPEGTPGVVGEGPNPPPADAALPTAVPSVGESQPPPAGAGELAPTAVLTARAVGPTLPTIPPSAATAIPGLPPVVPTAVPPIVPTDIPPVVPTVAPPVVPTAPPPVPTIAPVVPTVPPPGVPTAPPVPTVAPVVPTVPPPVVPTVAPPVPTVAPIVPTVAPIVPTVPPPVVPTAVPPLPTTPPIIPTEIPALPTPPPIVPTTPPIVPTAVPAVPTTPPIVPTIPRP